ADEAEVEVQALLAREVLLVREQTGGRALDGVARRKDPLEAGLLEELASRGLERGLAFLHLAADRQPRAQALVLRQEDAALVAREDRDREAAPHRLAASLPARAVDHVLLEGQTIELRGGPDVVHPRAA